MRVTRKLTVDLPDEVYETLSRSNIYYTGQEILQNLNALGYYIVPAEDLDVLLTNYEKNS